MKLHSISVLVLTLNLGILFGCSGASDPMVPDTATDSTQTGSPAYSNASVDDTSGAHYLWAYYEVFVDPSDSSFEILPARAAETHWNVLTWLENGPCTDCLKILLFEFTGQDTVIFTIKVTSPFETPRLTGFDVRGIAMFHGSAEFPGSGLTYSDRALGDGELVNADGYTTLYNGITAGAGPGGLQGYLKGKLATVQVPDSLLNGYRRFVSDIPGNVRNAFYAGDDCMVEFKIDMPDGPFVFGYAVDANWAPPLVNPVTDPMTDFPPAANCAEPWKVEVTEEPIGPGLHNHGGSTKLIIDVYDWQSFASHAVPVIECPELFDGFVHAELTLIGSGFATYEAIIENELATQEGTYKCLVSVTDYDNIGAPDWLDLTAYRIIDLEVAFFEGNGVIAIAKAEPALAEIDEPIHFTDNNSFDLDGGEIVFYQWDWDNNGTWDEQGPDLYHTFFTPGLHEVQFQVTDDQGQTDTLDEPLKILIKGTGPYVNPDNLVPDWFFTKPLDIELQGNYAYIGSAGKEYNGLYVMNISNPEAPFYVASVPLEDSTFALSVDGNYAYVVTSDPGTKLYIIDISNPLSPSISKELQISEYHFMVCDIFVTGGYAYIPLMSQFQIIDVDPPEEAHQVGMIDDFISNNYCAVRDGYAYLSYTKGGLWNDSGGLAVIDVDPPDSPTVVFSTEDIIYSPRAVGIFDDKLYLCGAGMGIYDISDPENPVLLNTVPSSEVTGNDVVVDSERAYLATAWGYTGRIQIVDINPPEEASLLTTINTDNSVYNLDADGDYIYSAVTEFDNYGDIRIFETGASDDARPVGEYCHLRYVRDVAVDDNYVYILDHILEGLIHVVDKQYNQPLNILTSIHLNSDFECFCVADGYAYVSTNTDKLDVYDIDPIGNASPIKTIDVECATRILEHSGYLYCRRYTGGVDITIVDTTDPASAFVVNNITFPDYISDFAFCSDILAVVSSKALFLVDVTDPSTASLDNTIHLPYGSYKIDARDGYIYITFNTTLNICRVDSITELELVRSLDIPVSALISDIALSGNALWMLSDGQLYIADVTVPELAYFYEPSGFVYTYCDRVIPDGDHVHFAGWGYDLYEVQ